MKRRTFINGMAVAPLLAALPPVALAGAPIMRRIPGSGEAIPAIGMGSWLTFDVGEDEWLRAERCEVLRAFFAAGGRLIDSSPMYGSSEAVIGHCLEQLDGSPFAATKVWTYGRRVGIDQMEHSRRLWGGLGFDLMQIHNLLDWQSHLETLKGMKARGEIRYIGITTSHGRRHQELERLMAAEESLDFVQFTYNIEDREAERRLLPLAAERGLAVIINRPFQGGRLFERVAGKPLPGWAAEIGCENWAQFFLKFITSHPAVSCAIPATSRVDHMGENMGALSGPLPDAEMRRRMVQAYERL